MESVENGGIWYKIVWVWHYSDKAIVLLDMGLCAYLKTNWLKKECVQITAALDVPKIGKQVYNLHQDFLLGKVTETQHIIRSGFEKMHGYQLWVSDWLKSNKKKKR